MSREEPVVLPFRPREGWERASSTSRVLTTAAAPIVLLAALAIHEDDIGLFLVLLVLAVPAFAFAARVLRPYPVGTRQRERRARHLTSAATTVFGGSFLVWMLVVVVLPANDDTGAGVFGYAVLFWLLALLLGLVTVVWGVIAMSVRAARRDRPDASGSTSHRAKPHPHGQPSAAARSASTI